MARPECSAAKRSGPRSFDAVEYQKSPSVSPWAELRATSVSERARRRAPYQVPHSESGDHVALGSPVEAVGS